MSLINDLVENLKDANVVLTSKKESSLEGVVIESDTQFRFEINFTEDIATVMLTTDKLCTDLLEKLADHYILGLCLKKGVICFEKRVFLSGCEQMDVFLVSQWLLVMIFHLGDQLCIGRKAMNEDC